MKNAIKEKQKDVVLGVRTSFVVLMRAWDLDLNLEIGLSHSLLRGCMLDGTMRPLCSQEFSGYHVAAQRVQSREAKNSCL